MFASKNQTTLSEFSFVIEFHLHTRVHDTNHSYAGLLIKFKNNNLLTYKTQCQPRLSRASTTSDGGSKFPWLIDMNKSLLG